VVVQTLLRCSGGPGSPQGASVAPRWAWRWRARSSGRAAPPGAVQDPVEARPEYGRNGPCSPEPSSELGTVTLVSVGGGGRAEPASGGGRRVCRSVAEQKSPRRPAVRSGWNESAHLGRSAAQRPRRARVRSFATAPMPTAGAAALVEEQRSSPLAGRAFFGERA